jgi:hypothetical protein
MKRLLKALESLACLVAAIIAAVWVGTVVALLWTWWRTA